MRHAERLQALGLKVRIELLRRGWYEPRLASELGMSARTLNDRLNAHSDWKLNELLTLSDVLWKGDFLRKNSWDTRSEMHAKSRMCSVHVALVCGRESTG